MWAHLPVFWAQAIESRISTKFSSQTSKFTPSIHGSSSEQLVSLGVCWRSGAPAGSFPPGLTGALPILACLPNWADRVWFLGPERGKIIWFIFFCAVGKLNLKTKKFKGAVHRFCVGCCLLEQELSEKEAMTRDCALVFCFFLADAALRVVEGCQLPRNGRPRNCGSHRVTWWYGLGLLIASFLQKTGFGVLWCFLVPVRFAGP